MKVYVDDREVRLSPSTLLGTGGEADVYDAGGGRAIKVFKGPDHPDVRDLPALRDAARERLAEHQHKLARFPRGLPPRVVAPERLATDRPGGSVVGYAMRLVAGAEPLARYAEPRFRQQGVDPNDVVAVLRDLHLTVCALHRAGIVLGDLNDRNVLVEGTRAHLIDADSFQFGPYFCGVFTERFVDPMLCDPALGAPVPVRRYGESSDWYAYAAMLFSTLLCVGPFGRRAQATRSRAPRAPRRAAAPPCQHLRSRGGAAARGAPGEGAARRAHGLPARGLRARSPRALPRGAPRSAALDAVHELRHRPRALSLPALRAGARARARGGARPRLCRAGPRGRRPRPRRPRDRRRAPLDHLARRRAPRSPRPRPLAREPDAGAARARDARRLPRRGGTAAWSGTAGSVRASSGSRTPVATRPSSR
ncbi:MAG: hypothetical protein M5U28_03050 [Sandaracinaceae bacterium]|nr:hypothetical protein [Sandaracinaceae bacterium]